MGVQQLVRQMAAGLVEEVPVDLLDFLVLVALAVSSKQAFASKNAFEFSERVVKKPLSVKSIVDAKPASYDGYAGGHFRATLKLNEVADTYIDMSKWRKGTIYVNGYNLGRYWSVGPQYSLYCPAPFLRKGDNEIDIVELELAEPKPIQGLPRPLVCASEVDTENAANVW